MFNNKITEMLKVRGMSESCLSERIHKTRSYIRNCRVNDRSIPLDVMDQIAIALDVSLDYLCGTSDQKENAPVKLTRRTKKLIKIYDSLTSEQQALIDSMIEHFSKVEGLESGDDD